MDRNRENFFFVGSYPNSASMFGLFPYSVGFTNVKVFMSLLVQKSTCDTESRAGMGFTELAAALPEVR